MSTQQEDTQAEDTRLTVGLLHPHPPLPHPNASSHTKQLAASMAGWYWVTYEVRVALCGPRGTTTLL